MKLAENLEKPVFLQSFPCSMPVHKITIIIIILVSKKPAKLIEFQFNLLHRRIPTDDFLLKIGRKENDNCTVCNNSSETLVHLFWSCHVTSSFWKSVTDQLQNALPLIGKYNLLKITALGLRPEPHSTKYSCQLNYCLLLARFHIWQAKMDEISPNFANFLRLVKSRSIIEKKNRGH